MTASADETNSVADGTVGAIDAVAGHALDNAIDVSSADSTISAGHGVSVDLSSDASDGIVIDSPTGGDLEIGLPFPDADADAAAAAAAKVVDGVMVNDNDNDNDNGNGSSATPLVQDDGSVQVLATIADGKAPTAYEYQFAPAPGASLSEDADGGVSFLDA